MELFKEVLQYFLKLLMYRRLGTTFNYLLKEKKKQIRKSYSGMTKEELDFHSL